jgi:hypothetical protein
MENISLILIAILFMLGYVAYKRVVVSPRKKHEKLTQRLHAWVKSFDRLDSLKDKDERALCLHELLVDRRILIKELNEDVKLKELITKLENVSV